MPIILSAIIALFVFLLWFRGLSAPTKDITVTFPDGSQGKLLLAETSYEKMRGLSNMKTLEPYDGMLFVFKEDHMPRFWMKDMYFDIDIIWLDELGVVVELHENVSKTSYPKTFSPQRPIRHVLEMSAGEAKNKKISIGQKIILPPVFVSQ